MSSFSQFLPADLAGFVAEQVRSGVYASEAEVVSDALRLLRSRNGEPVKDVELSRILEVGYRQIDGGEAIEVDETSLGGFFASLRDEAARELSDKPTAAR